MLEHKPVKTSKHSKLNTTPTAGTITIIRTVSEIKKKLNPKCR